ncbi:hypothetical protein DFH07DRAFT_752074 [Mycena maculata]|uniref:SWIM-type domain-containing protein n=1 Tax=Mycena maculata TaxID=230809 RepID=A0AAD7IDW3_9AGAR|nr:hypothetical protein DFH07DRAFT_752074 [Mycena maculata]
MSVDTDDVGEKMYKDYVDSVQEDGASFIQISKNMFVVNGWDAKRKRSKDAWYHIQQSNIGPETVYVCTCPSSNADGIDCVHEYLLKEYGVELFPGDSIPDIDENEVVLFSRLLNWDDSEDIFLNHFSCPSPHKIGLTGRVVVTYEGDDEGNGRWNCEKDSGPYLHVGSCRKKFQQLVQGDPEAQDTNRGEDSYSSKSYSGREKSVSYQKRPPPLWAALPGDLLVQISPATSPPVRLTLDPTSSCSCSDVRYMFQPFQPILERPATIYGLVEAYPTTIEIQTCICKHRFIGPDCASLGIFNYNNKVLFTHEILDEYTSAFTTSETPFSAWVEVTSRRYILRGGTFCSADIFRSAWFAYARLLSLEDDMICPKCGPSPENTIWDGVTLAFNRKHLLPSLEPPTISQSTSISRDTTRYIPNQQLLPDSLSRKLIIKVVDGPPLIFGAGLNDQSLKNLMQEEDVEDVEDEEEAGGKASKQMKELLGRLDAVPLTVSRLAGTNPPLSHLFERHFGTEAIVTSKVAPDVYKPFFLQISADESVLQMANQDALKTLDHFITSPTKQDASALINIPVLHNLLAYEFSVSNLLHEDVMAVCCWISERGRLVLGWLNGTIQPLSEKDILITPEKPWTETGCCYGMPKIRDRPTYPKLKFDTRPEASGKRGAKCSKFYSQYGEKKLTGGIMCAWCTHSICYGFHCIPKGEGRNDVFSALVTRWERPPKRVIYDFACALGPYCMTREPAFFADTQFLIDDFHASGHTKCAPAAFLKTYCAVDPRLRHINSSAGECGNSGISRIRKSVSYMSQDRAIVYTKVFVSIWNRQRIKGM